MQKYAFIPSRDGECKDLVNYLESAGYKTEVKVGCSNIFDLFDSSIKNINPSDEDIIIFCHDDIEIQTRRDIFNNLLESKLSDRNVGFVGVAGTSHFQENCVWWDSMRLPNSCGGTVLHGDNILNSVTSYYGPPGQMAVLDGLFLAATGKTLKQLHLKKPSSFEGNWDFYDIYYTAQSHIRGFKNYAVPILILHRSKGELAGKESWHKNRQAFYNKYHKFLPLKTS